MVAARFQITVLYIYFRNIWPARECVTVGLSLAYVVHFIYLRDFWIRTQRAAVASRRATNLAH
jgi:hypothetical protein